MGRITEENETVIKINFPAIKVAQPIGEFFVASIDSKVLCDITYVDVRRILDEKRGFETYLGIQRELDQKRVKELNQYVNTKDACFPTAVIIAVDSKCVEYDSACNVMTLSNYPTDNVDEVPILYKQVAKVLDGQHRIEGLRGYKGEEPFFVNVSIFVDADLPDQAYIFSTVNLAQTKVNKSLVYDLFELAKTRSPQKICHNVAIALDRHAKSPFYKRIKRLGAATEGRLFETITQATFVESLIRYICLNKQQQIQDRDLYLKGKEPLKATPAELKDLIFRNMFIDKQEIQITDVIWNYFAAVCQRWPNAWESQDRGIMLNKTNGFKALMRFLKPCYLHLTSPGGIPEQSDFFKVLERITLREEDFSVDRFKPGTSGESDLYRTLLVEAKLDQAKK
jgi:DGQHR domain-containing protein